MGKTCAKKAQMRHYGPGMLLSEYRKEYIERSVPFPHEADRIPELDGKSYVESVAPLDGRSVYTTTYPAHPLQLPKSTKPAAAAAGGARDRLFEGLSTYKHDYPAKGVTPDNGAQPSAPGPADLASGPFYDSTTHKVDYADPGPAAPPRTPGRADTVSTQRPAFDGVSAYQADYTEKSVPRESVSRKKADDVPPSMPLNAATSYGTDFRPVAGGAARLAAPRRAAAQSGQWAPGALRSQYAVAYDEKPRVAERFTRPATASHLPSAPFDGNTIHRMTYPAYQPSPARRPATAGAARSSVPRPFYGSSEYRDRYVPKPMMAGDGGGGATSVPTAAIPPAPFFASTEYGSEYVRLKVAGAAASARPRQPESAGPMMPRSFVGDTTYNRAFTTAMMPVVRDVRTRRQEAVPDVSPPFANHTMYATDYVPLKLPSRTMCADRPWTTCDSCK